MKVYATILGSRQAQGEGKAIDVPTGSRIEVRLHNVSTIYEGGLDLVANVKHQVGEGVAGGLYQIDGDFTGLQFYLAHFQKVFEHALVYCPGHHSLLQGLQDQAQ
jgi:hypothetical protein